MTTSGAWSANGGIASVSSKVCKKCKSEMTLESFTKDVGEKDGLNRWCKSCRRLSPEGRRRNHLQHQFKMTPQAYEYLLAKQGGVCAICKRAPGVKPLNIDHDHRCCSGRKSCGKCIRGLLCAYCNGSVVPVAENPLLHGAAVEYLRFYER
jgi:hypothetical protein